MNGPSTNNSVAMNPIMEIQMNIKRAFLIVAALMLIPGFAMAQSTTTFDTEVFWVGLIEVAPADNLKPASLSATRTCNSGVDLVQPGTGLGPDLADTVQFQVADFDDTANNYCEITLDDSVGNNIVAGVVVNGTTIVGASSCRYVSTADTPDATAEVAIVPGGANDCRFLIAPPLVEFTLIKEWDYNGTDPDSVAEFASVDFECRNMVRQQGLNITTGSYSWYNYSIEEESDPDDYLTLPPQGSVLGSDVFYHVLPFVEKTNRTNCTVYENVFDSSVESDNDCAGSTYVDVASPTATCTITNTVFFEGIPTLSQYGMAILALLMLGVGFVSFRRFA